MKCPFCGFEDTKVIDSRFIDGKKRRRRRCTNCGRRFTTYECVELPELLVNKKDNTYEPFDRNKLIRGLSFAVKKRPVPGSAIIAIADSIENYCANNMLSQISTSEISDMVLEQLKKLDEVAYVRFASENIWRLIENGVVIQSNASFFNSVVTRGKAMRLLRSGFIHLLGSDCHNLTDRPPAIGSAYEHIEKKLGRSYVERITETGNALLGL